MQELDKALAIQIAEAIKAKGDEYYDSITHDMPASDKIELMVKSTGFDEAALIVLGMAKS